MDSATLEKSSAARHDLRYNREHLVDRFNTIREYSSYLVEPLEIEDFVIQAMTNASPTKWHLAHTSWFYETFILAKVYKDYESLHPRYAHLFNSYYLQTGNPYTRDDRGLISRPTVKEVFEYRDYVNNEIRKFLEQATEEQLAEYGPVIEIGNNHEQQHQELILTDLKYMLSRNPLYPVYREREIPGSSRPSNLDWIRFEEGIYEIGNEGDEFIYDNEHPRHRRFLEAFEVADRLITNREYMNFMEDGGYERSELWLDDGWSTVNKRNWKAPLYWIAKDGEWYNFTLSGLRNVHPDEPVTHVSYYEADAFARWAGARLINEAEWEVAARNLPYEGNFVEENNFHPVPLQKNKDGGAPAQLYGDVWEWTQSAYDPYPGYEPLPGALGEYNGKFMCGQYVLRGGSCATSQTHIRKTYRNFFYPDARWQFNGIRLARTI